MARGESPKERPLSIGLAIVAIVVVASICTLYSVVASMRTGAPSTPYAAPATIEPFRGATTAFGTLSSRDSTRAVLTAGATLTRDPVSARTSMENALRDRGYVVGATTESAAQALPLDATVTDLDGACGVVLVLGDVGTTIHSGGIAGGTMFRAIDPSAFTVASCGTADVHLEGTGNVTMRAWLLPGLTPSALTSTGLPPDALLGHAEMETLLRRRGYAPVDELIEVTPLTTTPGGFVTVRLPASPTAGCIPFVVYAEGAGRPQLSPGRFDYLDDRGLSGGVACATTTSSWEPLFIDDTTIGARVFVRAYGPAPGTPSATISIGAAIPVDAAHATWPTPIAEAN